MWDMRRRPLFLPTTMAQLLFWPGKLFFYPIGNTSAVSLARDVSPDKDISLLLLGCGDPRNVLFTLVSEHKSATRKLDFTCVDFEPGVLARNVLLLSLIIDKKPMDQIFDIFFHFYLEPHTLALLVSQCQALWRASLYGSTLHMSSEHTLAQLRLHWQQYSSMHKLPKSDLQPILTRFKAAMTGRQTASADRIWTHTSRSAGPLIDLAVPTMKHGTTFVSPTRRSAATLLNPTFVYSRGGTTCDVHYGTDPLTPFHLAPVFGNNAAPSHEDIMKCVRAQFHTWCTAFHNYHGHAQCIVRFFFADAIFATRALKVLADSGAVKTRIPVCQWHTDIITFDKEEYKDAAPVLFDVVDTSNLDDHLGLLNVMITSIPLLPAAGNGVLYLESLLVQTSDGDIPKDFAKRFNADLSVICVLFQLCPVDFATGYSSRGNVHELNKVSRREGGKQTQFHQVTTWKTLDCDPPVINPWQLGTFLYDWYHALFEEEDSQTFSEKHRVNFIHATTRSSLAYFCRESFVLLLKFVRDQLQVSREDWIAVMDRFIQIQMADQSMKMDTLRFHDCCALMYYHGVYTMPVYHPGFTPHAGPFKHWNVVSPLSRVFLKVPREKIAVLTQDQAATPSLEAGMRGPRMMNLFSCIHAAFGTVSMVGPLNDPRAVFEEDPKGFHGSKPLIVSFVMPSMLLKKLSIVLVCNSNTANIHHYFKTLGPSLEIHSAELFEQENVIVIPEQPMPIRRTIQLPIPSTSYAIGAPGSMKASFNEENNLFELFSVLTSVQTENAKSALQSAGNVSVKQISFRTVQLNLEGITQDIVFPFPVVGSQHRLRIARKSLWIELIVPLRTSFSQEGLDANPFPISLQELLPWSIHRINLDSLPTIDLKAKKLHDWLNPHVGAAFSKREVKGNKKKQIDSLRFVKESISSIIVCAAGIRPKGSPVQRIFALQDKATNNCDTVIFVDQLRFDLSSHTIVCDGFILPLTPVRLVQIVQDFRRLIPKMVNIGLDKGEITSWKQLFPVLVERCRTWKHLDSCQYASSGCIPLNTQMEQVSICACGEGKDVQRMSNFALWKPLAKYCTRIALSPLFGVSYLETIGPTDRRCCVCRANAGFTCPKCKKDRYCRKECQAKDWKRHKEVHHES
ncbi:hypothetical protein R3P38DRAFT_2844927, partial [Favolaschia claudopus]